MKEYQKDFAGWAKVAAEIEKRERRAHAKPGVVYWANLGVNIGSELVGKGEAYTRPVLVLEKMDARMVMIVPVTSRQKVGRSYREIMVAGKTEFLALGQARMIDALRLGDFIDEVSADELERIWKHWVKFLKYHFYKKSSPAGAERDF